jgi:sulfite exporter TauE/SafE
VIRIFLEGLALGLSTGAYCLGMCFVFFMPYLCVEGQKNIFENSKKIGLFLLGRLIAYVGFAFVMGFLGVSQHNIFNARLTNLSLVVVSLLMLFYALTHHFSDSGFCKSLLSRSNLARLPFFLGLFSGLNPCLPFLVGLTRLWTLNSILGGVVLFVAFFIGTSVYMIPLIFVSFLNRVERVKQIGLFVALLSSVWFLFVGITGLMQQ